MSSGRLQCCNVSRLPSAVDVFPPEHNFLHRLFLQPTNVNLKLVVCILLRVLGQVQGFRLTQHYFRLKMVKNRNM
jgi:hypothetical protein